jgi:hypothetical protein
VNGPATASLYRALVTPWQKARLALALASFALAGGACGPRRTTALPPSTPEPCQFAVGAVTSGDKIYPDSTYRGSFSDPIRLSLAGNETRSFQLVVIPYGAALDDVTVSFSELTCSNGNRIAPGQFRWFRVGYVKLETPPAATKITYAHAYEPDPLLPAAPFSVPAHEERAVWVDLQLPEGTPAASCRGAVSVSAAGQVKARDIEVAAAGFDLPRKSSLATDFWFSPVSRWNGFYVNDEHTVGIPYTPEMFARHAETLSRYRVTSFPVDWTFLCKTVSIFEEPSGNFSFDWSIFDRYVKTAISNGSTAFSSALSCNSGWTAYLNTPNVPVVERSTGEKRTIDDIMHSSWDKNNEHDGDARFYGRSQFENPVYRDFLVAYTKHLKDLGINNDSYYELFDEAPQDATPKRWQAMVEHHRFLRRTVPDLRLQDFGFNPTDARNGENALGLIDTWAPHLFQLADEGILKALYDRRQAYGEKFWFYVCTQKTDAAGNWTPYALYHQPYIAARIHGWFAWKWKADGFLIYALNAVPRANLKPVADRWPNSDWSDGGDMGVGTLVYPGPNFELIPGMRLANVRDGLEDYEYFVLLRTLAQELKATGPSQQLEPLDPALTIGDDLVSSVFVWTKDPALLDAKRAQLAGLIRSVRAQLERSTNAARSTGNP